MQPGMVFALSSGGFIAVSRQRTLHVADLKFLITRLEIGYSHRHYDYARVFLEIRNPD